MEVRESHRTDAPLRGKRILLTRAVHQASELASRLRALEATPIECPAIAIVPPASYAPLDAALQRPSPYDWIIFTSANGVRAVAERAAQLSLGSASLPALRLGAIGPATAQVLAALFRPADFVPGIYVAEAIVEQIGPVAGQEILLPRADIARAALAEGLRARGATVEDVTVYRTVPGAGVAEVAELLRVGRIDALLFTSSSTVRYFLAGIAAAGLKRDALSASAHRPAVFCIGPITASTARAGGLPVDAVAREHTMSGLIAALNDWFQSHEHESPTV